MGFGVARVHVMRVVGAAEGRPQLASEAHRALGHAALLFDAVRLNLHEVEVLAEDFLVPAGRLARLGLVARRELAAHLGVEAARENEQTVGVLGEKLVVHPGLVVEALEIGLGDQLDQVAIAGLVSDQNGRVARALVAPVLSRALEAAARGDIELGADDGLDAGLPARRVEIDGPEEIAVIGEGQGGKAELGGAGDEAHVLFLLPLPFDALDLLELGGPVEQAVLGVDVEVDEVGARRAILAGARYSHSIVLGGLEEMSYTTRFTPLTSLMMRDEIRPRSS